ncbi:MAG TPA: hypothetical protein VIZ28_06910 [Chitinophagaceae bacterium]
MIRSGFSFCFFFLLLLTSAVSRGQGFSNPVKQTGDTDPLLLLEKLYLHADKNFYLAGEIIWFKIYYADGSTHQPGNISKVAYAEILDRNNKPVLQAKIPLTGNGGNGSFYLPLTLNSDHYTLRAYTNWMKNAGNGIFFEKKISIVNTMKTVPASSSASESSKAEAAFFPESGHLVEGIETKVAFRITDHTGKGSAARGIVTDNTGDTIVQFSPHRFGIGNFLFRPLESKTYKATILLQDGKFIDQALPVTEKYGYVMNITDNKDGKLKVRIQAKTSRSGETGEQLFLLVHNSRSVRFSQQPYISYNNELVSYIDRSKLGEGVNHVTLFNKDQQPVCERLVFIRPLSNRVVELNSNKQAYGTRQAVDLSVSLKGSTANDEVNCSVSVYQLDSLQEADDMNIATYFSLLSDLKGNVESPAYYLSDEAGVEEATDNLLLTHGWRRFKTGAVPSGTAEKAFRFLPEYRGHFITGKVINVTNGKVVANADCFLTVPSSPYGFYMSQSDSTGIVKFDVRDYYGPGEIIGQVSELNKANYRIDFFSPFSDDPSLLQLPEFMLSRDNADRILQKSIAMQAQNIYRVDSIRRFTAPQLPDTLPFFGNAEFIYPLDDYKRFTTMEEVLREYVTPVNVALRNGKLYMSIFDEASQQVYHDNMLVLMDGVPLADYNKIFSFDPLKVKKLSVVPRRYVFGARLFSGVVSFESYSGKFEGFELDSSLIAVDYEGLQMQREFYSPAYEAASPSSRIPDLRTTLYWTPELPDSRSGKTSLQFYTSDMKGKFIVVLEGLSKKGEPVFGSTTFEVK